MICDSCKTDRLITDFINNHKFCYHCTYRKKLEKKTEKQTQKHVICRVCGNEVIRNEKQKKRQRTVFCSSECAEKGHKDQIKNHWIRKMRAADSWKF